MHAFACLDLFMTVIFLRIDMLRYLPLCITAPTEIGKYLKYEDITTEKGPEVLFSWLNVNPG